MEPGEEIAFYDQIVCYLGDRLNAKGGSEAAVTARTRIGWIKFRECEELVYGKKFSLKMKGRIDQSCVRSAMLYGSETWCLRDNQLAILRKTEKAMTRAMCGVKMIEKKRSQELRNLLSLKDTLNGLARATGVRWYGHVLKRALDFKEKKRAWATEYEVEQTSGGAYRSDWTEIERCHRQSKVA